MRPSDDEPAKLKFGWPGAVLAKSAVYADAVAAYKDGHESKAKVIIEKSIDMRTLFDGYFDSPPDRVSLYSSADPIGALHPPRVSR